MKRNLYLLNFLVIAVLMNLMLCQQVFAVTASPYPFDYQQPDGSVVKIKMMGDEWVRWAETMDHYTLLRNAEGAWEYATTDGKGDIVVSGYLASNADDRSADELTFLSRTNKSLSFSKDQISFMRSIRAHQNDRGVNGFPTTGTINVLVILMQFQDVSFTKTQTNFNNLMNQVNYNGTGSFGDFHYENSYGNLTINTTVAGPYTAANNMAYYGANDTYGNDLRPHVLASEAATLADPSVNYVDFDNDNDGEADAIYVIYAGYGEEAGASANAIWAHAYSFTPITLDGKTVKKYACSAELRSNSGTDITGIGVICHEFGHSLGAPDYYDTDYSGSGGEYDGTGEWDMMASGSWNSDGDIPAHHNPFTKYYYYNWLTPTTVTAIQEITLRDISTYADVVRVNTTTSNEYFLFENRQQAGFNAACPGHGMIIYHVDGTYVNNHYNANDINVGSHQGMYIMSATSTTSSGIMLSSVSTINTAGCPWPGTGNKAFFTDTSTPWAKSWLGNPTNTPVLAIQESGGNIVFCLNACDNFKPGSLTVVPASSSLINLSWTQNTNSDPVMVAYSTVNSFGTPTDGTVYTAGNTIVGGGTVLYNGNNLATAHTGLTPGTAYFYKAWSVGAGNTYSAGIINNGSTFYILPYTQAFSGTTIPQQWSQVDHQGNGQIWQFGTAVLFNQAPSLTGNYAYLDSDGHGNGNSQNVDLISPTIDMTDFIAVTLQFNHYFYYFNSSSGTLSYSINNGASWTQITQWTSTTTNPAAFSQMITAVAGKSQVKFKWNYTATWANGWAIDDISITGTHGPTWTGTIGTDWNVSGNWAGSSVPTSVNSVIIPLTANQPVIKTSAAYCNNLTIQSGAALTINPGYSLTVSGTLTNAAGTSGLLVKSDAVLTGSIIHYNADVDATFERTVTNADFTDPYDGWHFLSSPVASQAISPAFTTAPYDFYCWYEPGNVWVNYKNTTTAPTWNTANGSTNFTVGRGYMAAYDNGGTRQFTGKLNVADVSVSGLTITGAGTNRSWHLLGNPFASALSWDGFSDWNLNNIAGVAKIWDEINQSYTDLSSSPASIIPATNGFMVQVISGTGSLALPKARRVSSPLPFYKNTFEGITLKAVNLTEGNAQESRIIVNPAATPEFDLMYDGEFLAGYAPQFYSISDNERLSTNSIPEITKQTEIMLGFVKNNGSDFRIEASGLETLQTKAFLRDLKTGVITNLNENPMYEFTSAEGDDPARFELRFGAVGIDDPTDGQSISAWYADGVLYLSTEEGSTNVDIFNVQGQILHNRQLHGSGLQSFGFNLPSGVYFARIVNGGKMQTVKIIIQ
jgi:M6 family metalloprotease-like protein